MKPTIFVFLLFLFSCASEEKKNEPTTTADYSIVIKTLDTIFNEDQAGRQKIDSIVNRYGIGSKEEKELWRNITSVDSINVLKVENIIARYGWLGADAIGEQGNTTLFLVIQHANTSIQEKYLPIMRKAVKENKANAAELALLEDRVLISRGKSQRYGSQISRDDKGRFYVQTLANPDSVDQYRASVGLGPLAEYVANWNIKWDVEQYKKQQIK